MSEIPDELADRIMGQREDTGSYVPRNPTPTSDDRIVKAIEDGVIRGAHAANDKWRERIEALRNPEVITSRDDIMGQVARAWNAALDALEANDE